MYCWKSVARSMKANLPLGCGWRSFCLENWNGASDDDNLIRDPSSPIRNLSGSNQNILEIKLRPQQLRNSSKVNLGGSSSWLWITKFTSFEFWILEFQIGRLSWSQNHKTTAQAANLSEKQSLIANNDFIWFLYVTQREPTVGHRWDPSQREISLNNAKLNFVYLNVPRRSSPSLQAFLRHMKNWNGLKMLQAREIDNLDSIFAPWDYDENEKMLQNFH